MRPNTKNDKYEIWQIYGTCGNKKCYKIKGTGE